MTRCQRIGTREKSKDIPFSVWPLGFIGLMLSHRIPDPEAVKPDDWDEDAQQKIEDPDAVKPDGWLDDGMEYVPDPDASMPEDWYGI